MAKIAYDKPVKDLISELNATGHVTHSKHRKDMVTLHHNGGRLSHEGVLNVWKTRPASAHFDVDGKGAVAQYVNVNEYAWATGSTNGNQRSISIEMANATLGPNWTVANATWQSAARLAGWLFARVIGDRPTKDNLVVHHHWKSTLCAGPFIDAYYNKILSMTQTAYDSFTKSSSSSNPNPKPKPPTGRFSVSDLATQVLAGHWGIQPDRERRLKAAGYDYDAVQAEVNRRLGRGAPAAHRPSVSEIARQVINGEWGNQPQRQHRLQQAGYNYREVQNEVNRQLS